MRGGWSRRARWIPVTLALAVVAGGLAAPVLVPGRAYATAACSASTVTVTRVSSPVLYLDTSVTPNVNSAYEGYRVTNGSGSAYEDLWVTSGTFAGPQIHLATYSTGRSHLGALANAASGYAFFYLTATAATSSSESHVISVYTTRPDLASGPLCTTTVTLDAASDIAASANKVSSVSATPSPPQLGGSLTITVVGDAGTIGNAGIFATTPASYAAWQADAFKLTGSQLTIGGTTYQNTLYLSGLSTGGAYTAVFTFAATGTTATSTSVSPMSHISSGSNVKHTSIDSTYQALSPIPAPANNTSLSVTVSPTTLPSTGGAVTYTVTATDAGATAVTLDDITVTLATGETYVGGSTTFNGTTVGNPSTSGSTLTFVDRYPVPATGTGVLVWRVSVPATAGTYQTGVVGHVGTTQIDTSVSTSTDSPATASVTVAAPPPTVSAVSPGTGTDHGGTAVTVSGTNFVGVTAVTFGSTAASSYTVDSATSITVAAPAGSAGTVDVTITTISGTSPTSVADRYTYTTPPDNPPVYTGAATNTSQSVVAGAGLTALAATDPDGDTLTFAVGTGSLPAGITLNADGTFTGATTTPGDTSAAITVSDGFGGTASTTLAVHVATPAPAVTSVSPASGTTAGGTSVTVTGTWLTGATAVLFGGTAAGSYTVDSATSITVTAPAGSAGTVDVTVTTPAGTSATGSADRYTYVTLDRPPTYTAAATNTSQTVGLGAALTALAATDPDDDPLSFTLSSGALPAGITVNTDGSFAGTTTTPGDTSAVIVVSDGRNGTDTTTLVIHVLAAPLVTVDGGAIVWTTDATPTISGTTTAADGSTVTVTVGGQTLVTTVSAGRWAVTATLLSDGPYPVVVTVTDPIAGSATAGQQLAVDTQPPPIVPVATTGYGTDLQTVTVDVPAGGSVTLLDGGSPVSSVTVPGQGIYTLDAATGVITFAPVLGFTGTATPATFRATTALSATIASYYTATVIAPTPPVTPPRATIGPATQSVTITLPPGGTITLLDDHGNPVTTLVVVHVGTYRVVAVESAAMSRVREAAVTASVPSAVITFTPVPGFTGTAPPVTFRVTDAYGQQVIATYTPTVTPRSGTIPVTGPDVVGAAALGLWLVVVGVACLVLPWRRRVRDAAS